MRAFAKRGTAACSASARCVVLKQAHEQAPVPKESCMQRIVVLNPKGGSGKTTLAITLAAYFAQRGDRPVVMDHDPQGSAARWVRKRQAHQPAIHLIAAYENNARLTRSFQLRIPDGTGTVVVDTAAAVEARQMPEFTATADKILVPVLPSDIDIHACTRCISNLLLVAKVRRSDNRLGIVANRVKRNTTMYQALLRFLDTLDVPLVGTLRESQNYIRSAESGMGLHEMKNWQVAEDLQQWAGILEWLATPSRQAGQPATPRVADEAVAMAPPMGLAPAATP
jgi:chromosome partitioning protein